MSRYVGWCLNDKHATVRAEALRALRRAFELKTLEDNADLFISRFKRRMVDMCDDVSVDVVCEAVAVSGQLARLAQLVRSLSWFCNARRPFLIF